jgi:hypothetical protein
VPESAHSLLVQVQTPALLSIARKMKTPKFDHTNPKHWNNLARRFRRLAKLSRQDSYVGGAGICYTIYTLLNDPTIYKATNPINKLIATQKPPNHRTLFYWPFNSDGMMSRSKACDRIATLVRNQQFQKVKTID